MQEKTHEIFRYSWAYGLGLELGTRRRHRAYHDTLDASYNSTSGSYFAAREEGVGHYLTRLASSHIVEGSEVWTILIVTRLTWPTTSVAANRTDVGQAHNPQIERVVFLHVCVEDAAWRAPEACRVRHYLGQLPSGSIVEWAEVRAVTRREAWLYVHTPAWVATHMPSVGEAVDPYIEWVSTVHIFVYLGTRVLVEACGVGYYFGYLPSRDVVEGAEGAIIVP